MVTFVPGNGTDEARWRAWPALAQLPLLNVTPCRRAVVVAPHPDDETLAVGGLMAVLLAAGAEVVLVAATDGEASHPTSTALSPERLREVRTAETTAALAALGRVEQVRLGLPDGGLAAHEVALADALARRLGPDDWCVAPYDADAHPDHDAGGRAAQTACDRTGARLLSYPLWAWHWATPDDTRLPWHRARRLLLPANALRRKQLALACYPSQTEPLGPAPEDAAVVPPAVLAHFQRPYEVLFA